MQQSWIYHDKLTNKFQTAITPKKEQNWFQESYFHKKWDQKKSSHFFFNPHFLPQNPECFYSLDVLIQSTKASNYF